MTLQLTFADLRCEVCNYLGAGDYPSPAQLAAAGRLVNEGYRRFLLGLDPRTQRAYAWSFLDAANPPPALAGDDDVPLGAAICSSAVLAAALAAAEQGQANARGPNADAFDKLICAAIDADAAAAAAAQADDDDDDEPVEYD